MTWTVPDQTGRTAVVTGGNAGLGRQVALGLARAGASVVLACRNPKRAEQAAGQIHAEVAGAKVSVGQLDLADLASVTAFATTTLAQHDRLHLLLNNAGLMAVDPSRTADGFETQLGVNHLGHFALTAQLLPLLERTPGSRVVTMSSLGHRAGRMRFDDLMGDRRYGRWSAYFQAKLANLLFTAALHRRLTAAGSSTAALAAHPGLSSTDLGTEGSGLTNRVSSTFMQSIAQPAAAGALPMLRAATDPAATGGQFYGPRFLTAGQPVVETPSRRARDEAAAERLWRVSAELTGQDFFTVWS